MKRYIKPTTSRVLVESMPICLVSSGMATEKIKVANVEVDDFIEDPLYTSDFGEVDF